ncbi:MAG: thioredoxin-dependent thiol peroxidase [Candidatus Colwellbacteria bacterium]|nr:thioredoxin-dependent thiol peroxidase [Candidatus Colwellbacteria bacterium]
MLKPKNKAPKFSLSDQNGRVHSLSENKGKWVLLYFYPKDDTPGCTKEACSIRDGWPAFKKLNCVVWGVSADSIKSHKNFSDKHKLPFTILSDENKEVINLYGVWGKKKFMGREYMGIKRISFLIDPEGFIYKIYKYVKPADHASEVLADLDGN